MAALRLFLRLWQPCISRSNEGNHHQRKKKARATTNTGETRAPTTNNNEGQSAPQGKGSLPTTQKARVCASFTLAFAWRPCVSSLWKWTFPLSFGWRPSVSSFGDGLLFPLQQGDLPCRPCQEVPWVPGSVNLFMFGLTENMVFRCLVFWVLCLSIPWMELWSLHMEPVEQNMFVFLRKRTHVLH